MVLWKKKKRVDYVNLASRLHSQKDFWEQFWKEVHCPGATGSKYCTNPCQSLNKEECCIICTTINNCLDAGERCALLGQDVRKVAAALLSGGQRVA
jgi:hypothetical protein